jgi:hypothetical protein
MIIFEVVFITLGLVLGFVLASVFSGLGSIWQTRDDQETRWVAPFLAVWFLANVASFWSMDLEIPDLMPSGFISYEPSMLALKLTCHD